MSESNRSDLAKSIGERDFVSNHCGQRQTSDEKDENELKGGHLLSRTPANNANHEHQEEVSSECSYHGSHEAKPQIDSMLWVPTLNGRSRLADDCQRSFADEQGAGLVAPVLSRLAFHPRINDVFGSAFFLFPPYL